MCCTRLAENTWCKKSPSGHHRTTLSGYVFATKARIDNRKQNYLIHPHNMVNFGPLAADIVSLVWGTPANFNGFRLLAALLHGTPAKLWDVEQRVPLYIRQGGHHLGHWPTFLVNDSTIIASPMTRITSSISIPYCRHFHAGMCTWLLTTYNTVAWGDIVWGIHSLILEHI